MTIAVIILAVVLAGIVSNLIAMGVFLLVIGEGSETDDKSVGQFVLAALIPYFTFAVIATALICAKIDWYKKRDKEFNRCYKAKMKQDKKDARVLRKQFKAKKRLEDRG